VEHFGKLLQYMEMNLNHGRLFKNILLIKYFSGIFMEALSLEKVWDGFNEFSKGGGKGELVLI